MLSLMLSIHCTVDTIVVDDAVAAATATESDVVGTTVFVISAVIVALIYGL